MQKEKLDKANNLSRELERLTLLSKMLDREVINFGLSNEKMSSYHVSLDSEELNKKLAIVVKQYVEERLPLAGKEFNEL